MPANHSGFQVGLWQGRFGSLAWLYNVLTDGTRRIDPSMPWALDNGVYAAWSNGRRWPHRTFYSELRKLNRRWTLAGHPPRWIVAPDVRLDGERTLRRWRAHAPRLATFGVPLAIAVQDGMSPDQVPLCPVTGERAVVFVGGSDPWRRQTLATWCGEFPRVHVGRVNSFRALLEAADLGAESADGTGFFRTRGRGDTGQADDLLRFLRVQAGELPRPVRPDQLSLFPCAH